MALPRSAGALRAVTPSLRVSSSFTAPRAAMITAAAAVPSRPFTTSPTLQKKRKVAVPDARTPELPSGGKHESSKHVTGGKQKAGKNNTPSPAAQDTAAGPDPLDLAPLHDALAPIDAHFRSQLQTLLHGGRFNPDVLGALPVPVKPDHHGGGGDAQTFPLRELAQVVPRGRTHVSLLLNDAAYAKPILSAVQASPDFNQQPQRADDGNDLELVMRVEMERKEDAVRRVKEVAQGWRERVRGARAKFDKALKEGKKSGRVLPDDLRRAEREVQKVQDGKMREVEEEEKKAVRQLQR